MVQADRHLRCVPAHAFHLTPIPLCLSFHVDPGLPLVFHGRDVRSNGRLHTLDLIPEFPLFRIKLRIQITLAAGCFTPEIDHLIQQDRITGELRPELHVLFMGGALGFRFRSAKHAIQPLFHDLFA